MQAKILIIGYGEIAQRHYRNLRLLIPNSKFLILSKSIKKIKNLNFTKNIDIAKKFSPNLTLICSPVTSHLFYAKIFMDLNSNIFIEKPVANNVNQLQNFIQKIKKKKITILDGYNLRFDKSLIFFKNKILKNIQGKILCVKSEVGQYLPDWRKKNYSVSVSAKKKLGGGVINELSHDLDLIFMLFKSIKFVSAMNYKVSKLKINTEDTCHVVLKSKTRNNSFFIFVHMDFYRHDRTRKCTVIGSKATIEWDGINKTVSIKKNNSKKKYYKFNYNNNLSYIDEMKFFIKSLKEKKQLLNCFKRNIRLIKILEKIRKKKCFV